MPKGKDKGKRQKRIPQKIYIPREEEISSAPTLHPNATLTPDASLVSSTDAQWIQRDSTNAPKIGEQSEEQIPYAGSYAALIDKYLLSKYSIPFVIAIILIGWVFIQDNAAGKLINWQGIFWTIQKSGIILGIIFVILFFQFLYGKISGK